MALRAATFMLDHARVRRDYSARVDRNNTRLRRANWKRDAGGTMELHIRQRDYDAGLFPIDIMYEVWDGFVDGTDWSTQDLFGGYVRAWEVEKRGAMLIFTLDLVGYDIIFEKTAAPAYPDNPFSDAGGGRYKWHNPPDFAIDPQMAGYPPGYSAQRWLTETADGAVPWDGIVRKFAAHMDMNGVDNSIGTVVFDLFTRPSTTAIYGYMELLTLGQAIDKVMASVRLLFPDLRPGYYAKPIPDPDDPSRVKAQFRCSDMAAAGTADFFFSDDPADAGVLRYVTYKHRADGSDYYNRIMVAGAGVTDAGLEAGTGRQLIQRVWGVDMSHVEEIPTTYQTVPGWQLLVKADQITNQYGATTLAKAIAAAASQPRVTVTFTAFVTVAVGQIVRVKHRATQGAGSTGVNYQVQTVEPVTHEGRRAYQITAGWYIPTPDDIMAGPVARLMELTGQGFARNGTTNGDGPSFVPISAEGRAIYALAGGPSANSLQSLDDRAPGSRHLAAVSGLHMTPDGMPISGDAFNYGATSPSLIALPPPTERPDVAAGVLPAPTNYVIGVSNPGQVHDGIANPIGAITQYEDYNGVDGVQHHVITGLAGDGWLELVIPDPVIFTEVTVKSETDGEGAALGWLNDDGAGGYTPQGTLIGTPITLQLKKRPALGGAYVLVDPPVDRAHPLSLSFTDNVQLHYAGIPAGHIVSVLISSRRPDPQMWALGTVRPGSDGPP